MSGSHAHGESGRGARSSAEDRGKQPERSRPKAPVVHDAAHQAINAWDGQAFKRTRSAWRYNYPSQHDYVFEDLKAEDGSGALRSTRIYIDRVVALRDGTDPNRAATREEDRKAVEVLARRRIFDADIHARLEKFLAEAKELAPRMEGVVSDENSFQEAALALHAWLVDWRGQALVVIPRRDYLIQLGIASPRSSSGDEEDEDDADDIDDVEERELAPAAE